MTTALDVLQKFAGNSSWQPALAFIAAAFVGWIRIQEQRQLARSKRSKAFNKLLKEDRWRSVSEMELHGAMIEAFGKTVERAELALMMTRCKCAYLLRDRLAAAGIVRFQATADGWKPSEDRVTIKKLERVGKGYALLGILSTGTALEFGLLAATKLNGNLLLPLAVFCMLGLTFFVLASRVEAAARICKLDALFPPLIPVPERTALPPSATPEAQLPAPTDAQLTVTTPSPAHKLRRSKNAPVAAHQSANEADG